MSTVTSTTVSTNGGDPTTSVFDSYVEKQLLAALYGVVSFTGVVGNSSVLLAVLFSCKPRTTTNVFVVNMAVADLITCLSLPLMILAVLSLNQATLLISHGLCSFQGFLLVVCLGCSINNIAIIAFYRALITTGGNKPRLESLFTPCGLAAMVSVSWIIPISVGLLPIVSEYGSYEYDVHFSTCSYNPTAQGSGTFSQIAMATYVPVQFLVIFTSYTSILLKVRKHARRVNAQPARALAVVGGVMRLPPQPVQGNASHTEAGPLAPTNRRPSRHFNKQQFRRELTVTFNMFLVLFFFAACTVPYAITVSLIKNKLQKFVPFVGMLIVSTSCINPMIYIARHPDFNQVCRDILLCRLSKIPKKSAFLRRLLRLRRG